MQGGCTGKSCEVVGLGFFNSVERSKHFERFSPLEAEGEPAEKPKYVLYGLIFLFMNYFVLYLYN
jgi:hypothetical protein